MADRSITARLKADISDLRSRMREAADLTSNVGKAAEQTSKRTKVSFGSMAQSVRDNEQSIGKLSNVAGGLGIGLAVGVGAVVKTFADFDKSMSNVAATGDDARQNIDGLRAAAIKLGADSAFSAKESAAGIENLLKAGVSAADVMGGGLKGALDLAAAGELAVGDAAEIAATAMVQFNLEGSQVPHIADLLAAGAGKAQGEVSDMGAALNQSGLVASQFGLSIEETTGTLAAFASAGLVGSDSGTSFKTMLLALANPSKKSAEAMDALGISAYDAQGNFVGITALADQLKSNLGNLSQAQRDQTLAQIFGNDAVRAANALYNQGGEGITAWTKNVDDAGFASETAATKMDNLAGDVEKFKGALETAFIQSGSGANDFLRSLVQGAEGFAEAIGKVPAPVLQAGTGIAAVGAAGLLAVAGIGKAANAVVDAKDAFDKLIPAGGKARGAIQGVGAVAGAAAIGLAALQVSGSLINKYFEDVAPTAVEAETAILGLGNATLAATSNMDGYLSISTKADFGVGTVEINGLSGAFERLSNDSAGQKIQDFASGVMSSLGLAKGSAELLTERFVQLDTGLGNLASSGKSEEAAAAFAKISAAADAQGVSTEKLLELFPEYQDALQRQANDLGVTTLSTEEYAKWMGGEVPRAVRLATEAVDLSTESTLSASEASGQLTISQDALGKAFGKLEKETDAVVKMFTIFRDGALDADAASDSFEAALDGVTESVKANGKSLDSNTEKGRANRSAIREAISALNDKISADFKANVESKGLARATDIASEALRKGKGRLNESAAAAGLSKEEFKKLHGRMALTPDELRTQVNTPGVTDAQAEIKTLQKRISDLRSKSVDVKANVKFSADKLAATIIKGDYFNNPGAYAKGGAVQNLSGKGRQSYDTEPAMLRVDEHVWTPEEVDGAGGHRAMERMRADAKAGVLHYAQGGAVKRSIDVHGDTTRIPGRAISQIPSRLAAASRIGLEKMAKAEVAAYVATMNKKLAETAVGGGFGKIDVGNPRGITSFRGHRFTNLFAASLRAAEVDAGVNLSIFQGGFRPTTSYSGTSHRGDAVDHQVNYSLLRAMRKHGIADWDRTGKGNWAPHMHGVPLPGAGFAGGSAIWQAQDYKRGGDGLYTGTSSATAGWHWVGEKGPELRHFRGGETVLNASKSGAAVSAARVQMRPASNVVSSGATSSAVAQQIDVGALAQAVESGAARGASSGIRDTLRPMTARDKVLMVREGIETDRNRGGGR